MTRSLAAVGFIALIGGTATYVSQRPTVARGEVLAADLLETNHNLLQSLDCDPEIPVGVDGATFKCRAVFKLGAVKQLVFQMDRMGSIRQTSDHPLDDKPRPSGADPWD
jgi:hypothetical protein